MEDLVGSTILTIKISTDHDYVRFLTSRGEYFYQTYADCCSESWISGITGIEALIGAEIYAIRKVFFEENDGELKIYSYKFTTSGGYADLEFRNSSNGYYGGSLNRVSMCPKTTWKYVTEDFSN